VAATVACEVAAVPPVSNRWSTVNGAAAAVTFEATTGNVNVYGPPAEPATVTAA
jgi:hypothetical protein